jgi:UDP-N-acetylglucosamine/UDP-N-acetylgalactosamine diphosphorylase
MKSWSIGEVARFLGVKPHVIRYWESELPLLSPRKSLSGRREYTGNEIRLLLRFRHLLYDKKFTIEGAKGRLWEELGASADPDLAARFSEMRTDLIDALMTVRRAHGGNPLREGEDMQENSASSRKDNSASSRKDNSASSRKDIEEKLLLMGQEHLFAHWSARPEQMRKRLLEDLAGLDLGHIQQLRARLLQEEIRGEPGWENAAPGASPVGVDLVPAPYASLSQSSADREAEELGEDRIRRGRTAFLTVAGGQGSRLGFDGPKGMFPVTPLRRLTLFAWFAEKLLAARRKYGVVIPWLVMTGPQNHRATQEYFEKQDWFGLGCDTVRLFMQGSLPSLSPDGRLLLGPDGGLLVNPDGHGGVIEALRRSGSLAAMQEQGVEQLFYWQVDNPLVRVPDPVFLGFHCRDGSQISSKVIEKAYPEEKLGIIVTAGGKQSVIEYSDLDEARMHARGADGRLLYCQGSIAIHILEVGFLANPALQLPWHIARKKARMLNPTAEGTETVERDAVKMEMFVFDAIPAAGKALFFETERAEEFAPLKNREGVDSVETCLRGQVERAARWLTSCGVEVPRDGSGRPLHLIEISPLFALDREMLSARRGILKDRIDEDTLLA